MSDAQGDVKLEKMDSFQSTDSFDEPKGVPISMEPVFSTASGVRIDVKQESIDKSRKMLNTEKSLKSCAESSASTSRRQFSSPLIKSQINTDFPYISPFRKSVTSSKRSADLNVKTEKSSPENGDGAPPVKKSTNCEEPQVEKKTSPRKERKELHADVLRVSKVHEKDQYRLILRESKSAPLIIATISARRGGAIKFGDRIHVEAEISKKNGQNDPLEIYLEKVIKHKKDGAEPGIRRHSIALAPYCLEPKFIHELTEYIKKAVLQVYIIDLRLEIYQGCSKCNHLWPNGTESKRKSCVKCKSSRGEIKNMMYCRMRVGDFSGQFFLDVSTKAMEKLLELLGYKGIEQWIQFTEPCERNSYMFRPLLMEVERVKDDWECTDVADVDWDVYWPYLMKKTSQNQ